MEVRRAVLSANHDLAVDQERVSLQASGSFDNGREAVGPVVAVAGEAANARAVPAHHQPVAVMLDFVDPRCPGGWPGHLRRLARFDEAGGVAALNHLGAH
jgi:hypothetical protein